MNYLLVGNGPAEDLQNKAGRADSIIQINTCNYIDTLPYGKTSHVFLTNTGEETRPLVVKLIGHKDKLPDVKVVYARHPLFYKGKQYYFTFRDRKVAQFFSPAKFGVPYESMIIPFTLTLELERLMMKEGMYFSFMPSTGMIAYHWIMKKLQPEDTLEIDGFTFKGWDRHPWHIEKNLIKPIFR